VYKVLKSSKSHQDTRYPRRRHPCGDSTEEGISPSKAHTGQPRKREHTRRKQEWATNLRPPILVIERGTTQKEYGPEHTSRGLDLQRVPPARAFRTQSPEPLTSSSWSAPVWFEADDSSYIVDGPVCLRYPKVQMQSGARSVRLC
jgi:hypothetical protein